MRWTKVMLGVAAAIAAATALLMGGAYDVAADAPHWDVTSDFVAIVRDRSIAVRASRIEVPDLADPALVEEGAAHYDSMCAGCHMAPGVEESELRQGLNPVPPDLTQGGARSPAEVFWIIKHGIKMSAMPAWGITHDDASIWALVSFLRVLPSMDAAAYRSSSRETGRHDHGAHGHEAGPGDDGTAGDATADAGEPGQPAHESHSHAGGEDHH